MLTKKTNCTELTKFYFFITVTSLVKDADYVRLLPTLVIPQAKSARRTLKRKMVT